VLRLKLFIKLLYVVKMPSSLKLTAYSFHPSTRATKATAPVTSNRWKIDMIVNVYNQVNILDGLVANL
jgi:hypothetical protein